MTRLKNRRALTRALLCACVLALPLLFAACPKKPKIIKIPGVSNVSKVAVSFNISDMANDGHPVALDIVVVSDKNLAKELEKMSDWFARRDQIVRNHQKENELIILSHQWVPGQVVDPSQLSVTPETKGVFVFANYLKSGEQSAKLDTRAKDIRINIGDEKLEVITRRK